MTRIIILVALCATAIRGGLNAQPLAHFEVELPAAVNGLDIPVSVNLDEQNLACDSAWTLYEITGHTKVPVPFQVEQSEQRWLHWLVKYNNGQPAKRIYELMGAGSSRPGTPGATGNPPPFG